MRICEEREPIHPIDGISRPLRQGPERADRDDRDAIRPDAAEPGPHDHAKGKRLAGHIRVTASKLQEVRGGFIDLAEPQLHLAEVRSAADALWSHCASSQSNYRGEEMPAPPQRTPPKRWAEWRDYRTATNARVVKKEFEALSDVEYADIRAGMDEVSIVGMSAARHVRGDIYEVRADSETGVTIRVLFAEEGQRRKILLSLAAFKKKRQKTPENEIKKAQQRLADWRSGRKPAVPTKPRHTKPRR